MGSSLETKFPVAFGRHRPLFGYYRCRFRLLSVSLSATIGVAFGYYRCRLRLSSVRFRPSRSVSVGATACRYEFCTRCHTVLSVSPICESTPDRHFESTATITAIQRQRGVCVRRIQRHRGVKTDRLTPNGNSFYPIQRKDGIRSVPRTEPKSTDNGRLSHGYHWRLIAVRFASVGGTAMLYSGSPGFRWISVPVRWQFSDGSPAQSAHVYSGTEG